MNLPLQSNIFGKAASCTALDQITKLIQDNPENQAIRKNAAAFGMALCATQAAGPTELFEDVRYVLDQLAKAKAEIDIASWHDMQIVRMTAEILLAAQEFLDENTIGCTEWPTPSEVISLVCQMAQKNAA